MAAGKAAATSRSLRIFGVAACALLSACPAPQKAVVYDLAARLPFAERWSSREVILFGTPAAEPNLAGGFYREAGASERDLFVWGRQEAEVSLRFRDVSPRAAVVDMAPYRGVKTQTAEVRLNGTPVGRFGLNDLRHRYAVTLPASAQRLGENRLRFVFAAERSPAEDDPRNADERRLSAAFYSLVVSSASDAGLDDLLGREAPHPFAVERAEGVPAVSLIGPAVVRYAIRLPDRAELRFTPALAASARAAAGSASFRVTVERKPGEEREVWSQVLSAKDGDVGEISVALTGTAGEIARVGLHVGAGPGDRFAWGVWKAPRVLGRARAAVDPGAPVPEDRSRGEAVRNALAGTNVVFVILDAARARQLGCYGYGRKTTPEIDRIASEGVVFERAFTPAVYTLGAMSSVWTSQHPDRHHSAVSFSARLPKDRLTLAELLSAQGIVTGAFVANAVAGTVFGFDRGFSEMREIFKDLGSGAEGFRKVVPPWLEANKGRRFFAYLHFREPHFPYDPSPPFDTAFGPEGPIPKQARRETDWITDLNQGRRKPVDGEIEHLVRLYDGNLAFADRELGGLRRALEDLGLWENTVIVIGADHGEGLFEHGWIGHNVQLYEESIHVPLIVRFPKGKGPSGLRIEGLVDLLDVSPTIADVFGVLGLGGSSTEFQGRSLLPMLAGAPGKTAVLSRTVWDRPRYALRDDRYKFLYDSRTGDQELYDLSVDAAESRNRAADDPLRASYYRESLNQWVASLAAARTGAAGAATLTREQCENLKTLGYVSGCK